MRLGIFSDVHANIEALSAVMDCIALETLWAMAGVPTSVPMSYAKWRR